MNLNFRSSLQKGIVLSILIIFMVLIGFMQTISGLVGKIIGTLPASPINLVIFLLLMCLWAGSSASKALGSTTLPKAAVAGLLTGLVTAVVIAPFTFLIASVYANGIDLRTYLSALSPESVRHFAFQQTPAVAALLHLALLSLGCALGGVVGLLWRKYHLYQGANERVSALTDSRLVHVFRENKKARWGLYALLLVGLLMMPLTWGSYWNYIIGTVGIYILLGLGLNIIVGLSGQLVLGYVAFFGIGAYTFALLTAPLPHHLQWNFWLALVVAVALAALSGVLIGLPILRLRGDYLAIVTLGFGEIIRILLRSDLLTPLTAGPRGVRNLASPELFGISFAGDTDFMYLIFLAVGLVIFIASRVQQSHVGRSWVAIREDETVAQATGVDTFKSKLLALAVGAAFAGLGGALFASRNQFTGPEDHILMVSINVLCLVIVGGMGSIPGVILGAFALKGLPEILRDLENYRMLVFGVLLVIMMILRPEGLWPASRPRLEHPGEPDVPAPPLQNTSTEVVS